MSYKALGRYASSGTLYDINPSFSVFNSNLSFNISETKYVTKKLTTDVTITSKVFH